MKFDIDNYNATYVMHCKTAKEAKDFCNYLHEHGKTWCTGQSYKEQTQWGTYKQNTVYHFNDGVFGSLNYAKDHKYTILEWSDFMNNKFTKADLQTGDVIQRRDGDIEIVIKEFESFIRNDGEYNEFDGINNDLTSTHGTSRDIIAVRRPRHNHDCVFSAFEHKRGTLIYERKEVEEMTLAEVCKLLGKEIKIIK
jgi:hypothetical protein